MSDAGGGSGRSAEEILAEYVDGLGPGEEIDLESLCTRHPEHAGELRARVADWHELLGDLGGGGALPDTVGDEHASPSQADSSETIRRLQEHGKQQRYQIIGEFARGGMGAILRVWDRHLRRTLAMKVVLGRADGEKGGTDAVDERTLPGTA